MTDPVGLAKSEQVAKTLEKEIRNGRFDRGDQLDSEGGLMRRFSVSRNTVRRGLEILSRSGLITTRSGIGSFVTYDNTTIDDRQGWTLALSGGEKSIDTRLLKIERGGSANADRMLGVAGDYLCLDRLRYCNTTGHGICLERSRLPWRAAFTPILSDGLHDGSLSTTLGLLGLRAAKGTETAGVLPALSVADSQVMRRAAGTPMLHLTRVSSCADGSVLECVESILDPSRFGLRIDF